MPCHVTGRTDDHIKGCSLSYLFSIDASIPTTTETHHCHIFLMSLCRFRVTVSPVGNLNPNTLNVAPFMKVLKGQSLVSVTGADQWAVE